ncbi:MAG: glycerol uptake facilitator-like aquaporin [Gammaproteobacteria bacterium]
MYVWESVGKSARIPISTKGCPCEQDTVKEFLNHRFRYSVFFCSVLLLYLVANGLEKPAGSNPLFIGLSIFFVCAIMGTIAAGFEWAIRRRKAGKKCFQS